ncbi:MAG: 5'/3'-nucleotidase SurE [Alphaproteobacteria bacterium]|nr:5'/3'-nucleotidase SurE [Alphaproteobacteria bacterium]
MAALQDLKKARILVTNDDGYQAPGLEILEEIASQLSDDVWLVAPEVEQSGAGHSLTLRRPLRVRQRGPRHFSVDGTPTDCVLLAVSKILGDRRPDLVLSGVNRGGNMGEDVTYSGTVAAAMEATFLGVPAIALSQEYDASDRIDWGAAADFAPGIIRRLAAGPWHRDLLYSINFPPCPAEKVKGVRAVAQGRRSGHIAVIEGRDPKGRPYMWIGDYTDESSDQPGTDLEAVAHHAVAVTPLHLDLTHAPSLEPLDTLLR